MGGTVNGLSKLSKLARRIEKEITGEFEGPFSPFQLRLLRTTAEHGALAEQARQMFGKDPTVTRRSLNVLTNAYFNHLEQLAAVGGLKRKGSGAPSLAQELQKLAKQVDERLQQQAGPA